MQEQPRGDVIQIPVSESALGDAAAVASDYLAASGAEPPARREDESTMEWSGRVSDAMTSALSGALADTIDRAFELSDDEPEV